ncbi:Non-repetitive/WGA-negative nucleoporin C-terminal-domain-containing protein [Geopyxis carbonaria]|nr:Non-repetitive/WGA-negative nucleoporin C-terminal-domain-containing protein [Geopyxis carbonaria]
MSIFETPGHQRNYPGMFATPTSAAPPGPSYPDLPSELQTPTRSYSGTSNQFVTPEQQRSQRPTSSMPAPSAVVVQKRTEPATDGLGPVQRAAKTITETLEAETRYPQLDDIVSQGQSSEYDLAATHAPEPFIRTATHTIPDAIFEQYNRVTSHTLMGLFAELKQAWITVDNRLYLWDYATQTGFQGFEGQSNTITCVRLLKPKSGVFVAEVNYVLVIATMNDVFLLGVQAVENERGTMDVTLFETKMSVPTRGLDVTIIEGSKLSGRIFFAGKTDNDIYEFTYQAEERWFHGRCGKVCHTSKGASAFAPRLPFFTQAKELEYVQQIVVDDSRSLLYTLSSSSTIRAFQIRSDGGLSLSLTHPFSHTIANIRVMVGNTPLLGPTTPIISISTVSSLQARRTHLIATTNSGCRLFMSAAASEIGFGGTDSAPTSMQVVHIRYPPQGCQIENNVRRAKVFTPGYFFCFLERDLQNDDLFLAAPDTAKIMMLSEAGSSRLQLIEQGMVIPLESRVEACELVGGSFAAQRSPAGFGNELATQYDLKTSEIAILTNSGVHLIRRRRLVEVFDTLLRYGSIIGSEGVEVEVRKFFEKYGRAEGCASALAVACGASTEGGTSQVPNRVTDVEVHELARKYFIEFGGKPRADNVFDAAALPSLDSIKISGRAEGLALYISRIIRPIWNTLIINEAPTPTGGITYSSSMPSAKLKHLQEQLIRLASFLQENRSFIVGLSGAESLMAAGSKIEEVANQAEHRMLHALVSLIESMVEGISFVLFLFDDKLDDIVLSLPESQRDLIKKTTYGALFSSATGQNLAKELVTAIVNRNIAAGMNVDTIADALRRRCGSFCSADDVVIFKAVEYVRRAKEEQDLDQKTQNLRESLRLFEETAASLTMDNLKDAITEYRGLDYFVGAVQLALTVARESDRGNLANKFLEDEPTEPSEAAMLYMKRLECYQLIFDTLQYLTETQVPGPEMIDGVPSSAMRVRNDTWTIVYGSIDELFHHSLYDWMFTRGFQDRLLEVDSPYVLRYLQNRGKESIEHCELLWQYHARRENFYDAAQVLVELAQSEFKLTLERRVEYFSNAKTYSSSYGAHGTRQRMNELNSTIQEQLDVAIVQHEVLKRLREDPRISAEKKAKLEEELGDTILGLSLLFNRYADPYGYLDICLAIFQAADFRGPNEIRKCWEQLITQVHKRAESADQPAFEFVADEIRRLGHRFVLSEYIFPPSDLVPLLETYALEQQRDIGPAGWVVDTLLEAGIAEETLLRVLEEMFWRDEVPFSGNARRRLLADATLVVEKWWNKVVRRGGLSDGFSSGAVHGVLQSMSSALPQAREEAERVERLLADMARRAQV